MSTADTAFATAFPAALRQQRPGDGAPAAARMREELLRRVRLPRHDRGPA
jgi:hypothetical protein